MSRKELYETLIDIVKKTEEVNPYDKLEILGRLQRILDKLSKPSENALENEQMAFDVYEIMCGMDKYSTITDIYEACKVVGVSSPQKTTRIVNQLLKKGLVERFEEKKKAYYYVKEDID